nr:MAG TPA_asm: hypothetical protein [Caudoviricetes sp.]
MVVVLIIAYIIVFTLYSWYMFKSGKKHAEQKETVKIVITGKPEQIEETLKTIIEQKLLK